MRQSELNRAVAQATGETIETVSRIGFQHVVVPTPRVRTRFAIRRRRRRKAPLRLSA